MLQQYQCSINRSSVCGCQLIPLAHPNQGSAVCSASATLTSDAGLLARSQHPEGPATGHLDTGFSWFPCVYKRMLRWFPSFQVATTRFSCSLPDLNFLVTFFFSYLCTCKITTATGWQPNCSLLLLLLLFNTALYNVPYIKQIESHFHPKFFAPTTDLD